MRVLFRTTHKAGKFFNLIETKITEYMNMYSPFFVLKARNTLQTQCHFHSQTPEH